MRETKIERKGAILLAEAVFWNLLLGKYRVKPKIQWHLAYNKDLSKFGYTEVRALSPIRIGEMTLSTDVDSRKCRLLTRCVQFRFHSVVVMEVLLLGKEFIFSSDPKHPRVNWKIGSVRYRPIIKLKGRGSLTSLELDKLPSKENGRFIQYRLTNIGHEITLFGEWTELDSHYYKELQPDEYWPYDQISFPDPKWS